MMKRLFAMAFTLMLLTGMTVQAQKNVQLNSPNGKLRFTLSLVDKSPVYKIAYGKQVLVENSPLGFEFENGKFGENIKFGKPVFSTVDETYDLVVGKTKHVVSHSKQVVVPMEETVEPFRTINITIRAFDDALAFRYDFPEQEGWSSYVMYNENMEVNFAADPQVLALFVPGFINTHEGPYTYKKFSELDAQRLIDMPTLFEFPDHVFMAITEANLVDYAGMYLVKEGDKIVSRLSPKLGQTKISVEANLPHRSPWRVFMISDRVGALIESNILTNLADPCKIEDTSWLKPGKTTFTWWNNNVVPDTTFQPGNNFLTNKYYIDFAARNGLEYHSVYGYADMPWYYDDGPGFGLAGPNADLTRPVPVLDFKGVCDYAKSQGVDIHVWLNWAALYKDIDRVFDKFNEWGVKGMMVDFMDRDDQEMIRIQETILKKAAEHKLFIQFHGASKPSGLHRTYPNEFTREGTLNYECYKWGDKNMGADHDISMPFARLLAGPADYHMGGFRAVPRSEYKIHYSSPLVTSTRCHMLGMYIVLESYLNMVCDYPEAYEGQPGFEFLREIPTTWDATVVPAAEVNQYAVIARKHGNDWYVGAINNSTARTVPITLDFLDDGEYTLELYSDAEDVDVNPNHLVKETRTVSKGDKLDLKLAAEGGSAMRFRPVAK